MVILFNIFFVSGPDILITAIPDFTDPVDKAKIVIIGAGIHGLSTAWHLSKKYKKENDVVVIDKAKVASGASGIACGVIRNNYFQPSMRELMAHSVSVWESNPIDFHYKPVGYLQISPEVMRKDVSTIYEQQKTDEAKP